VINSVSGEFSSVVLGFVKSDDVRDSEVLEHLNVVVSAVSLLFLALRGVDWTHKRNELVGNNPIKVSVFNFLVVFVLFVVKLFEVVPAEAHCKLQPLQAVVNGAFVGASVAVAGVAEGLENLVVGLKGLPNNVGGHLEHHDHERAHQVGCIGLLVLLGACVVEQLAVFVALVGQEAAQLANVLVGVCDVQRPEVLVEGFVH